MTQSALPLFYREVVAFDKDRHGTLDFPEAGLDYDFARRTSVVPLLIHEVALALKSYPVVFLPAQGDTPPALVAMVGVGDDRNLFVEQNGEWRRGAYVPAWVRRYPFLPVQPAGGAASVLALDPTAPMLKQRGGEALIKDGEPSERLKRVIAFNEEFTLLAARTNAIIHALHASGVLEEGNLRIPPPAGGGQNGREVKGFLVVSESKLRSLASDAILKLHAADALGLAYAQLLSTSNLENLISMATQAQQPAR